MGVTNSLFWHLQWQQDIRTIFKICKGGRENECTVIVMLLFFMPAKAAECLGLILMDLHGWGSVSSDCVSIAYLRWTGLA